VQIANQLGSWFTNRKWIELEQLVDQVGSTRDLLPVVRFQPQFG
jgi:hypothetical protein